MRWSKMAIIPDSVAFAFFFMITEWAKQGLRSEWLRIMMVNSETLRLPSPIIGGLKFNWTGSPRVDPGFRNYIDKKYHKIILVVDFIIASGATGAAAIVEACELFAHGNARQWLKVAGEGKAEIVEQRLRERPSPERGIVTEFGSFVGYSCVRMYRCSSGETRILSLESDAIHVFIARHVVIEARCSQGVEIVPGMAHDSVRRLADDWGTNAAIFAFMDHRGTRFHVEWAHLQQLRAFAPAATFLADNTLKPGAPINLWQFLHRPSRECAINWSVPEFVSDSCEDWMSAWNNHL